MMNIIIKYFKKLSSPSKSHLTINLMNFKEKILQKMLNLPHLVTINPFPLKNSIIRSIPLFLMIINSYTILLNKARILEYWNTGILEY